MSSSLLFLNTNTHGYEVFLSLVTQPSIPILSMPLQHGYVIILAEKVVPYSLERQDYHPSPLRNTITRKWPDRSGARALSNYIAQECCPRYLLT